MYSVNITFIYNGKQNIVWLTLLQYLLYFDGLEPNHNISKVCLYVLIKAWEARFRYLDMWFSTQVSQ